MIGDAVTVGGPETCALMPCDVPHARKNTDRETGSVLSRVNSPPATKSRRRRRGPSAAERSPVA